MHFLTLLDRTNEIFNKRLTLPRDLSKEHEIADAKYKGDKISKIFHYRCWQARVLGFKDLFLREFVQSYMGESCNFDYGDSEKTCYDWMYNHHTKKIEKDKWCRHQQFFIKYEKKGLFAWPPFFNQTQWRCRFAKLNDLEMEFPDNVILKIMEVKALKLFNVFHAIQAVDPEKDPIILGTIWQLPEDKKVGSARHFFICDWYD